MDHLTSPKPGSGPRAGKRVAILQSNYIPWKGYFDLINLVDEFILYDDVQFTRGDWRNRNRLKTRLGTRWLTVPVKVAGRFGQTVRDTRVDGDEWPRSHWETIRQSYARARCFREYRAQFEDLYAHCRFAFLNDVNRSFIDAVCGILGITTKISSSADYRLEGGRDQRLVSLCQQAGAAHYVSGPAARAYLNEQMFLDAGIDVTYIDYAGYPEYPQQHPPFEHAVSILDVIFNVGAEAPLYVNRAGAGRHAGHWDTASSAPPIALGANVPLAGARP